MNLIRLAIERPIAVVAAVLMAVMFGLVVVGLMSAAILGAALVSQYGFGLYPCDLCIKQRIPYAVLIVLGMASTVYGALVSSPVSHSTSMRRSGS